MSGLPLADLYSLYIFGGNTFITLRSLLLCFRHKKELLLKVDLSTFATAPFEISLKANSKGVLLREITVLEMPFWLLQVVPALLFFESFLL